VTDDALLNLPHSNNASPAARIKWCYRGDSSWTNRAIMDFLLSYVGKCDLYVEDRCPAYVRYCFEEPMDAAIFRSRFERRSEPFRLAG
jgi:hypothetical protein